MKYLKEYIDWKNAFSFLKKKDDTIINNNLYSLIDIEEYEKLKKESIAFTSAQIIEINKTISIDFNDTDKTMIRFTCNKRLRLHFDIYIRKCDDEWFTVSVYEKVSYIYKCDQWDGLIACLEMLKKKFKFK